MDVTQLALTCVQIRHRPKWAQVIASQRNWTQALAKRSRKSTQVFNLHQLASPFGQGLSSSIQYWTASKLVHGARYGVITSLEGLPLSNGSEQADNPLTKDRTEAFATCFVFEPNFSNSFNKSPRLNKGNNDRYGVCTIWSQLALFNYLPVLSCRSLLTLLEDFYISLSLSIKLKISQLIGWKPVATTLSCPTSTVVLCNYPKQREHRNEKTGRYMQSWGWLKKSTFSKTTPQQDVQQ